MADLGCAALGLGEIEAKVGSQRSGAKNDVLGHAERRSELEVLMDHADATSDGVGRALDIGRFAADDDLSMVAAVNAVENIH